MAATITVRFDLSGLQKFRSTVRDGLRDHRPPFNDTFTQMGAIYSAFVRRRYDRYSKGGGDWAPLAESTIRGRRKAARGRGGKGGGSAGGRGARSSLGRVTRGKRAGALRGISGRAVTILRDTGTLFNATTIGAVGNKFERVPYGVVYGFSDAPRKARKGAVTFARLAAWHQAGVGRLPRRAILVEPDAPTQARLVAAVRAGVRRAIAMSAQTTGGARR